MKLYPALLLRLLLLSCNQTDQQSNPRPSLPRPNILWIALGSYAIGNGAMHMRNQYNPQFMATLGLKPYYAIPDTSVKMMLQVLREHGYFCTNSDKTEELFDTHADPYGLHNLAGQPQYAAKLSDLLVSHRHPLR